MAAVDRAHRHGVARLRRLLRSEDDGGYRVIRVTWLQLCHEPISVVAAIASALAASRTHG